MAGPSLLAMILYEKFGAYQPLNRLCDRFAPEGVPIPLSTVADAVGAAYQVLQPVLSALKRHVFSAGRLHSYDTTVKVLAAGKVGPASPPFASGRTVYEWRQNQDGGKDGGPQAVAPQAPAVP